MHPMYTIYECVQITSRPVVLRNCYVALSRNYVHCNITNKAPTVFVPVMKLSYLEQGILQTHGF